MVRMGDIPKMRYLKVGSCGEYTFKTEMRAYNYQSMQELLDKEDYSLLDEMQNKLFNHFNVSVVSTRNFNEYLGDIAITTIEINEIQKILDGDYGLLYRELYTNKVNRLGVKEINDLRQQVADDKLTNDTLAIVEFDSKIIKNVEIEDRTKLLLKVLKHIERDYELCGFLMICMNKGEVKREILKEKWLEDREKMWEGNIQVKELTLLS